MFVRLEVKVQRLFNPVTFQIDKAYCLFHCMNVAT